MDAKLLDLARLQRSTLDRWLGICIATNEADAAAYVRAAIAIKSASKPDYSDPHTYLRTAREMEVEHARSVA